MYYFLTFFGVIYSIFDSDVLSKINFINLFLQSLNKKFLRLKLFINNVDLFNIDDYYKIYKFFRFIILIFFLIAYFLSFFKQTNFIKNIAYSIRPLLLFLMISTTGYETKSEFKSSLLFIIKITIIFIFISCLIDNIIYKKLSNHYLVYISINLIGFIIIFKQFFRILTTIFSAFTIFFIKFIIYLSILLNNKKPINGFFTLITIVGFICSSFF